MLTQRVAAHFPWWKSAYAQFATAPCGKAYIVSNGM